MNSKKTIIFGTFDLLHKGHEYFIKESKKYGDKLFVVVARDDNVKKIKGTFPVDDQEKRIKKIKELNLADEVLLGKENYKNCSIINEIKPHTICLGYDQNIPTKFNETIENSENKINIIRIKSFKPHIHKSSIIRKQINE